MEALLVGIISFGIFFFCIAHLMGLVNIHMWLSNWHRTQALKILKRHEEYWEKLSRVYESKT